jgi:hypothetical protein
VLEETPVPVDETTPGETKSASPLPWIAFGIGGAGLAVGAVTGVMALGKHSDLSDACPSGTCSPQTPEEEARFENDVSEYHTLGTISGIGFAVGAAGIGTGIVLLLTSQDSESPKTSARFTPLIGPGFVGIRGKL